MDVDPRVCELWGVVLVAPGCPPQILGAIWQDERPIAFRKSEPPRALLFCSRKQADKWCRDRKARMREADGRDWDFRPVRVRETVEVVK